MTELTRTRLRRLSPGRLSPVSVIAALVALALAALVAYPLVTIVVRLATGHLSSVRHGETIWSVISSGQTLTALWHTAVLVAAGGSLALVVGALLAWLNERTDARIGWAAAILPLVSMFVPSLASAIGWVFLGEPRVGLVNILLRSLLAHAGVHLSSGPLNIYTWYGLIFTYAVYLVPFAYLMISNGFQAMDPALDEAARTSGASVWKTFVRVSLPSQVPALGSAVLLLLTMGFALFSLPVIIGTPANISVLPVLIVDDVTQAYPVDLVSAVGRSLLLVVIVGGAWYLQRRLLGRRGQAYATISGKSSRVSAVRMGLWRWPARLLMIAYLALAAVLPLLGLVMVALEPFWTAKVQWRRLGFANFTAMLHVPEVSQGLHNSILLGLAGALVVVICAVLVSQLTELTKLRSWRIVDGILKIPAAITHIIVAIGLIIAFAGPPFSWGGTATILLVAYIILYFPQASFFASAAVQQIGLPLLEAAKVNGAGPARQLWRVTLPLMAPALIASWSLIFVLITGDITASVMLSSANTPVIGFVMLDQWSDGNFPQIAALGVLMTVISTLVVLGALGVRNRFRLDR
jgi:iron(III) transport system permease protein